MPAPVETYVLQNGLHSQNFSDSGIDWDKINVPDETELPSIHIPMPQPSDFSNDLLLLLQTSQRESK